MAGSTGLEPAASGVTGRRSNQLNYDPELLTSNFSLVRSFELEVRTRSRSKCEVWAVGFEPVTPGV